MTTPPAPQYRLSLDVSIQEVDPNGYSISNNRLNVRDSQDLGSMDFLRIAGVLGRFHDLAKSLVDEPEPEPEPADEPEPAEPAPVEADDSPFNTMRTFRAPVLPGSVLARNQFLMFPTRNPSLMFPTGLPPAGFLRGRSVSPPDALERVAKRRRKYIEALTDACGCGQPDAHEGSIP